MKKKSWIGIGEKKSTKKHDMGCIWAKIKSDLCRICLNCESTSNLRWPPQWMEFNTTQTMAITWSVLKILSKNVLL